MVLKTHRSIFLASLIFILISTAIPNANVEALTTRPYIAPFPLLSVFVDQLKNGHSDELVGVYIPEILAARIIQQPSGENGFVSPRQDIVTQFSLASKFGSTGLLAHNYLAGESFSLLEKGQKFYLIFGDGQTAIFFVAEILRYQALEPTSPSSNFLDLNGGYLLTTSELFSKVYNRRGQVIFQTCIAAGDNHVWGRLFVIAKPYSDQQ